MPLIPNYKLDCYEESNEVALSNHKELKIEILNFDSLQQKYPHLFAADKIRLVNDLYNKDYTIRQIQKHFKKIGFAINEHCIKAILTRCSQRYNEIGWQAARNKSIVDYFLALRKLMSQEEAATKTLVRFAISRPTLAQLLISKGQTFKFFEYEN